MMVVAPSTFSLSAFITPLPPSQWVSSPLLGPYSQQRRLLFAPINQVPLSLEKNRAVCTDLPRFDEPPKQTYSSLAQKPLKTFLFNSFSKLQMQQAPSDGLPGCYSIRWANWWIDTAPADGMPLKVFFHQLFFFWWSFHWEKICHFSLFGFSKNLQKIDCCRYLRSLHFEERRAGVKNGKVLFPNWDWDRLQKQKHAKELFKTTSSSSEHFAEQLSCILYGKEFLKSKLDLCLGISRRVDPTIAFSVCLSISSF